MIPALHSVHFIGIGGTAMAPVAIALKERGLRITGSDQDVYPPMSTQLDEASIDFVNGYAEKNLRPPPDLVVVGNAISRGNPEVESVLNEKLRYTSLPELLRMLFLPGKRSIVVTGTHGKTTTASLLAWILDSAGYQPSFLIGGIPINFGCGARFTNSEWFVIEGDEYDTAFFDKRSKFVHYLPEIGLINNLEFDHADIFPDLDAVKDSFGRFVNLIPGNGVLLANGDDPNLKPLLNRRHCPVSTFGLKFTNDIQAKQIDLRQDASRFSVGSQRFKTTLAGLLNVRNALAAVACLRHCGLSGSEINQGLSTFQGVKRRLEIRGVHRGVTVIDDFAHHPTAVRETLKAARIRFPDARIWAVFEPRSNTTRRNVFQQELAAAFEAAHGVLISAIDRVTQLPPEERLDPEKLVADLQAQGKFSRHLKTTGEIVQSLRAQSQAGDVVCVLSNGGFGEIHEQLLRD